LKLVKGLRQVVSVLIAITTISATSTGLAAYPEKRIKIVVAFAPGGAADMLSRTIGQKLAVNWGQVVIVENRPGAAGNIGAEYVAKSAPDGYTLMLAPAGLMSVNPHLYPNMPFDTIKDFAPVTNLVLAPLLLVVNTSVAVNTFQELVQLSKAQPGKVTMGNGGIGTAQHLGGEYLNMVAHIKILQIPYKGSAPATSDLLGGQTHSMLDNMVTLLPHIKAGKLKPLAVTSLARVDVLPDVPTMSESGLPDFETGTWYGIVAPAGTPKEIVNKLQIEIAHILALPDVHRMLVLQGLQPVGSTPEDFGKFIAAERLKAGTIVKAANIKVD